MGILDRFEQRVDRAVNGAFAKAFKSDLQPVEIAAALQNEMDERAAVVSRARTVVPNMYRVTINDEDFERLGDYSQALITEFVRMVKEHATNQQYSFLGSVTVELVASDEVPKGTVRVTSEARLDEPQSAATAATAGSAPRLDTPTGTYPLTRSVTRIGRGTDVDIRLDDPGVSRHHAEIVVTSDVVLRDLGSTNGTYVNGSLIGEQPLRDGNKITIGSTTLVFRSAG